MGKYWKQWETTFLGSHEIKRRLLLERKAMTNLDNVLKSRDIILPTKVCLVKAMVFPVVNCGCESWNIKKAEHRRIDAFEVWCWRRLLRVPWTERGSNQSILKGISPEFSLERLMLNEELTDWKRPWCWDRWRSGGEEDNREWDGWMASLTQRTWIWASHVSWWWAGRTHLLQSMGSQKVAHDWETNWTELKLNCLLCFIHSVLWNTQ